LAPVKDVTSRWLRRADADLEAAAAVLERSLHELCIFHCQQALEKLLKAILIERSPTNRARRTHDLVSLAEELRLGLAVEQLQLLRRLADLYNPSRYGDEDVDFEYAPPEEWLRQTRGLFAWLRQMLS
jgi:HEPN domain-containing protein